MEESPEESDDAWLLLTILRQGLAGKLFGDDIENPPIHFAFINGGCKELYSCSNNSR
jgi:hypothetical protein